MMPIINILDIGSHKKIKTEFVSIKGKFIKKNMFDYSTPDFHHTGIIFLFVLHKNAFCVLLRIKKSLKLHKNPKQRKAQKQKAFGRLSMTTFLFKLFL